MLLPLAIADLSQSARAVDQQQVALAEWVNAELPRGALVGVNDTGAIAYLGERRTFDVVGLTTDSEGPAWLAGAGSRFERYERLPRASLPTHFLVYPEWFGCDAVLGAELAQRTVVEHAILGGDTMVAYVADYGLLGSGAEPEGKIAVDEAIIDEVDVADLESEAAHGFELGDAWEPENVAQMKETRSVARWSTAPRIARARDVFRVSRVAHAGRLQHRRPGGSRRAPRRPRAARDAPRRGRARDRARARRRRGGRLPHGARIALDRSRIGAPARRLAERARRGDRDRRARRARAPALASRPALRFLSTTGSSPARRARRRRARFRRIPEPARSALVALAVTPRPCRRAVRRERAFSKPLIFKRLLDRP